MRALRPRVSATLRRRRLARAAIVASLLLLIAWADHRGWLLADARDDWARYHALPANVVGVLDGDTIEIDRPDLVHERPVTVVRLWGIDCPELAHGGRPCEDGAVPATDAARRLAEGRPITLYLEAARTRGTFGRLLAHVELRDGSLLAERLLEQGLARTDERWPHAHLAAYHRAERGARAAGRGIWSGETGR